MEYCVNCGKPCGRTYRSSIQYNGQQTRYICEKCAEANFKVQAFIVKYLVLPIALVVGAVKGIRFIITEWIPSLCGSNCSADTVAMIQTGASLTLSILLAWLALKVMLKPWKRLKLIWRILLLIVVIPIVLVIFSVCFMAGSHHEKPVNQPQVEAPQIEQTPQLDPTPQVEQNKSVE